MTRRKESPAIAAEIAAHAASTAIRNRGLSSIEYMVTDHGTLDDSGISTETLLYFGKKSVILREKNPVWRIFGLRKRVQEAG